MQFIHAFNKGWYTYDVHNNCPIFKALHSLCSCRSIILQPPWSWTSNFKRTPSLSPTNNQLIKRTHNPENVIQRFDYRMLSGYSFRSAFVFSINSLILPGFPFTSFHLTEASLSAFSWLYILERAVVQKYHEMSFIYNYSHF